MKNLFKNKKANANPVAPRDLKAIEQEYGVETAKAGQVQYQLYVYTEELKLINAKLLALNQEAAKRNELDKHAEATKPKEQAQENV